MIHLHHIEIIYCSFEKKITAFPLSEQHLQTLNFRESIPDFEKNSKYYETCFLLVCGKKWDSAKKATWSKWVPT